MSKTRLTLLTALALLVIGLALFMGRRLLGGAGVGGPRPDFTWVITLVTTGKLTVGDAYLTTVRPPDFRQQHIFDERFRSKELIHRRVKGKMPGRARSFGVPPDWRAHHYHSRRIVLSVVR